MPIINIETVNAISGPTKKAALKAVHEAAMKALEIPADACHVRWMEIHEDNYFCGVDKSDKHVYIEIKLFSGRSLDVKKRLYQFIFQAINDCNLDTQDLMIALNEIPKENWGLNGGKPASEISFNYKINI